MKEKLQEAFIQFISKNNRMPRSINELLEDAQVTEDEFRQVFKSLSGLEESIWDDFIEEVLRRIKSEPVYHTYSAREKFLAFEYTLLEVIKDYRKFVNKSINSFQSLDNLSLPQIKTFRKKYKIWAQEVIDEGIESGELKNRPLLSDKYVDVLWLQVWFIIQYWLKDKSKDYEQTDAAIEKSLNMSCDFLGHTPLDSAFDFAKFLFQKKK
ncbi:MAG: hypothetical protein OHK0038_25820 [Flammeovirgaceae bacterium]